VLWLSVLSYMPLAIAFCAIIIYTVGIPWEETTTLDGLVTNAMPAESKRTKMLELFASGTARCLHLHLYIMFLARFCTSITAITSLCNRLVTPRLCHNVLLRLRVLLTSWNPTRALLWRELLLIKHGEREDNVALCDLQCDRITVNVLQVDRRGHFTRFRGALYTVSVNEFNFTAITATEKNFCFVLLFYVFCLLFYFILFYCFSAYSAGSGTVVSIPFLTGSYMPSQMPAPSVVYARTCPSAFL